MPQKRPDVGAHPQSFGSPLKCGHRPIGCEGDLCEAHERPALAGVRVDLEQERRQAHRYWHQEREGPRTASGYS